MYQRAVCSRCLPAGWQSCPARLLPDHQAAIPHRITAVRSMSRDVAKADGPSRMLHSLIDKERCSHEKDHSMAVIRTGACLELR